MDLFKLAAQLSNVLTPGKKDAADRKELLPPQQKTRPYFDTTNQLLPVKPMLMNYKIGEDRGNWIMKYYVQWPFGYKDYKQITNSQMKLFALDHLKSNSDKDEKYIDIVRSDNEYIVYHWNIDRWMNDNFNSSPQYKAPISLIFPIKYAVPRFIYSHAGPTDIVTFIINNFKQYVRAHKNKLYSKHFKFLKYITPEIFSYNINWQKNEIKLSIKYSIILGALALYSTQIHNKQFSKKELSSIKTKVSRLGDVGKLDKYLDGIKNI